MSQVWRGSRLFDAFLAEVGTEAQRIVDAKPVFGRAAPDCEEHPRAPANLHVALTLLESKAPVLRDEIDRIVDELSDDMKAIEHEAGTRLGDALTDGSTARRVTRR